MAADSKTTAGTCPAERGGRMEDCAAYPACGCDHPAETPVVAKLRTWASSAREGWTLPLDRAEVGALLGVIDGLIIRAETRDD